MIEPARKYMFIFGRGESGDLFYVAMKDGLRYGPLKRKSYFPRIKGSISAAYVRPSDNRMILFSGKRYDFVNSLRPEFYKLFCTYGFNFVDMFSMSSWIATSRLVHNGRYIQKLLQLFNSSEIF